MLPLIGAQRIYLADCDDRGESPRTVEGKRSNLGFFIRWCQGQGLDYCHDIDLANLELYRSHIGHLVDRRRKKRLDIATQRNRLSAIKGFLRRLQYLRLIEHNPSEFFESPGIPRRIPRAILTEPEIELILDHVLLYGDRGIRDRAILETLYATGLRRMEVGRLTITDVDFATHVVQVNEGKGRKDRRVPIASRACHWIRRYLTDIRPQWSHEKTGPTLFLSTRGNPLTPGQLSRLGAKYIHRAGVNKPGACHVWRHSAATLMLENGAGLRQIQEMLGHASIATTQIYTHLSLGQLKAVYARTHPAARVDWDNT